VRDTASDEDSRNNALCITKKQVQAPERKRKKEGNAGLFLLQTSLGLTLGISSNSPAHASTSRTPLHSATNSVKVVAVVEVVGIVVVVMVVAVVAVMVVPVMVLVVHTPHAKGHTPKIPFVGFLRTSSSQKSGVTIAQNPGSAEEQSGWQVTIVALQSSNAVATNPHLPLNVILLRGTELQTGRKGKEKRKGMLPCGGQRRNQKKGWD
jgi:hypothetical protein